MRVLVIFAISLAAIVGTSADGPARIVGGSDAPEGQYPYQVSIQKTSHFCGGSILNKRWIMTAAHCLAGQKAEAIRVRLGTNSRTEGGELLQADLIKHHENYRPLLIRNDIGLVRVNRDIVYNEKVQPIKLPTSDFTETNYPAMLSGWGTTSVGGPVPDKLQHLQVKVISQLRCRLPTLFINKGHICTLTRIAEGACNGDSGGPLVADDVQIGIVSFGIPCGLGLPDVYTRVFTYVDWIKKTIEQNS